MNGLAINSGSPFLKFKVVAFVDCRGRIQKNPAGQDIQTERFVNRWIASNTIPSKNRIQDIWTATVATLAGFKAPANEHPTPHAGRYFRREFGFGGGLATHPLLAERQTTAQ